MKSSPSQAAHASAAAMLSLLLVAPSPVAAMLRCDHVQVDGQRFNFKDLSGPHSVVTWQDRPPYMLNTTYTLDLCAPLKKSGDAPKNEQCPNGSRVCAIARQIDADKGTDQISEVVPIAGDLRDQGWGDLDPKYTRLKTSESSSDAKKEGVRIALYGGKYQGREQRAIVEMICDHNRKGTEGEWVPKDDKYEKGVEDVEGRGGDGSAAGRRLAGAKRADGDKDGQDNKQEHQLLKENAALIFDSYDRMPDNNKVDVLRLTWHTKYACEGLPDDEYQGKNSHWGFFTWLVILAFLGVAAYLIFGSWLNYNRYGARGWDLLPHGDTIRDVPYLLKDWTRRVLNTVQGSGSRGGYSAV